MQTETSTVISRGIDWKNREKGHFEIKPVFWLLTLEQVRDNNLSQVCVPKYGDITST